MKICTGLEIHLKTKKADSKAVHYAVRNLKRDWEKVFNINAICGRKEQQESTAIWLVDEKCSQEGFNIRIKDKHLEIGASDVLGFVYGIYAVSREILGIHNFWFWNDQTIEKKKEIEVPDDFQILSKPYKVRYRGWFINDEVLIHTWKVNLSEDEPWEMALEALLRCGGNLVIPGTGKNADKYNSLAASMGLYITHHHAQPLGARMFVQAYPELNPSYKENADKFQKLWQEGIEKQKDMNVIWALGFRGQGDYPFWVNDPAYQTPKAQGELISSLLYKQYEMIKSKIPDAVCCTNLYGETMELYQKGFLKIPDDVIKIWADNGFGKMVTRRQENHNPRILSLPQIGETGKHGIYYHVSFYDLQAASHITMLANSPEFVKQELEEVLKRDMTEYWLINCSNVKPHVYFLDFIAKIWQQEDVDINMHRKEYITQYYGEEALPWILDCFKDYPKYALAYGPNEDDHAGEQFSNHVARILISQYMKNANICAQDLAWATKADTLEGQVIWYQGLCMKAAKNYQKYLLKCEQANIELAKLRQSAHVLFEDSLLLQVQIHYECFTGAALTCDSLLKAMDGQYQKAFYLAGCARERYLNADCAMRSREHGKWVGFYANECLTDVKQTAWVLKGLMSYLRNLGDGPHYYQWQRDFLYKEEERKVMLIMNMENHLQDSEIFALMKQKWDN